MNKEKGSLIPWSGPAGLVIPAEDNDVKSLVNYARGLNTKEKERLVKAFESGYFDMGTEFLWRKAMAKLRNTIATLGMKFVGEMLNREDITEFSSSEEALTDHDAIQLAEALGVVNPTGAMRLRHSLELLAHFATGQTDEELSLIEAMGTVRHCIQYVLGDRDIAVPLDFSRFRDRLRTENLRKEDIQYKQLVSSPPFFLRTTLRVLLASVRTASGAHLEHTLANLNLLLPEMWENVTEADRWMVGTAYAEISAAGNTVVVSGLKRALLKVAGFDYVPENLRSNTYKQAAQAVLKAHFSFDNYLLEKAPTQNLASLGTTIPRAAFLDCIQAYLSVYLGNFYGYSWSASPIAQKELKKFSKDRWQYYLDKALASDDVILDKLMKDKPSDRFITLTREERLDEIELSNNLIQRLVGAASKNKKTEVNDLAKRLYNKLKQG